MKDHTNDTRRLHERGEIPDDIGRLARELSQREQEQENNPAAV